MDELIKMVQDKTGISADQARTAVDTVLGFVKDRLPEPLAGQIEGLLGGSGAGGAGSDALNKLGGMLGKK
jgi:hypothetical protein